MSLVLSGKHADAKCGRRHALHRSSGARLTYCL